MSKQICIINGPNINMLGKRPTDVYGSMTLDGVEKFLTQEFGLLCELTFFQSNSEGDIISKIQSLSGSECNAIVINPAAYSHTSVGIRDALETFKACNKEALVAEVHISNIHQREEFRHFSYISSVADCVICGMKEYGYKSAIDFILLR